MNDATNMSPNKNEKAGATDELEEIALNTINDNSLFIANYRSNQHQKITELTKLRYFNQVKNKRHSSSKNTSSLRRVE